MKQESNNNLIDYKKVEEKVLEFLPNSQQGLKIVLAVALSSQIKSPVMLWMLLVGVPSSGKTDLVRLVKDCGFVYSLDNLTLNAFVSGERATEKEKVHDLLPSLDGKCLVIKDWTSIFSLDEKMTRKLLGELVGIYDKEFSKFSSRRGKISYDSYFSQLGAVTPATLNKHSQYMNIVGPRFLNYILPETSELEDDKSFELIFEGKNRNRLEIEAREIVKEYLEQISNIPFEVSLNTEGKRFLRIASELISFCRGIVITAPAKFKNDDGKEITYYEVVEKQKEKPWRALQQLIWLSKCLAFVAVRNEVSVEDLEIIKAVVLSSMPADRARALNFIKDHQGTVTANELKDALERSGRTSRRLLDELSALGVLDKDKGSGSFPNEYQINDKFKTFILKTPAEFMSSYSGGTEITHSTQTQLNLTDVEREMNDSVNESFGIKPPKNYISTNITLTSVPELPELKNLSSVELNKYYDKHVEWLEKCPSSHRTSPEFDQVMEQERHILAEITKREESNVNS